MGHSARGNISVSVVCSGSEVGSEVRIKEMQKKNENMARVVVDQSMSYGKFARMTPRKFPLYPPSR